jgi:hypothetical protein
MVLFWDYRDPGVGPRLSPLKAAGKKGQLSSDNEQAWVFATIADITKILFPLLGNLPYFRNNLDVCIPIHPQGVPAIR